MPYIKKDKRRELQPVLSYFDVDDVGTLNFILTIICLKYLRKETTSYQKLNNIIGVLECVKQEFYRRVVVEYEDEKIKENGDVY